MFDPQRIRQARRDAGLSQRELARRLGKKSTDTVRGYEAGRIQPPGDVVERIAEITGKRKRWFIPEEVSPDALEGTAVPAGFDPDEPEIPLGLQRLIDMGLQLSRDELQDLVAYDDPLDPTRGARGAVAWSPGQWLDVLLEERRRLGR